MPVVEVGPVAHGGHCVARLDGQVVFVRHALPGETVRIEVTESSRTFLRADAVEIIEASPHRVVPPCRWAGTCGGCDFQHATPAHQRELLTAVVAEQLQRLAGITWEGQVEAVAPDLGWRTRVTWAVDGAGRAGLRRHRSHEVVPVDRCEIAHPGLPDVHLQEWDDDRVEAIVSSAGHRLLVTDATVEDALEAATDGVVAVDGVVRAGSAALTEVVEHHEFRVTGSGFWQVHPAAAGTLVDAVMAGAAVRPGDVVADLYAGVGLFTAFLADAVGPDGLVHSVEADPVAARDARRNLHDVAQVRLHAATTERALRDGLVGDRADVVVLDPPRAGAKRVVEAVAALGPRTVVHVACDPAALARDLAGFAAAGYRLADLRGFALFPMTHHVECVALLIKTGSDLR
ncbi:putative 23S rRNA (uracil-5-)-methyltransferase RumA [Aeromicrobium marinum DSM 15272]|uniref:23S rRNA (Uracil-5-)-methyltransferase RumA n=1 Tax=Aeromicrobium marinum DSM 15272 TaxID=585531 RepID=E2SAA1_9ACTN|nr:TRAM domain-containing protein [Aeromicrobium marinum]EFQ84175.1 putative 23S rRNA (uracil-5-)-methyltransferase RumA [Aeromicrobium marinum DSM 15272]